MSRSPPWAGGSWQGFGLSSSSPSVRAEEAEDRLIRHVEGDAIQGFRAGLAGAGVDLREAVDVNHAEP